MPIPLKKKIGWTPAQCAILCPPSCQPVHCLSGTPGNYNWEHDCLLEHDPTFQNPKTCFETWENLVNNNFLICAPTIPGFCFRDKYWGKVRTWNQHSKSLTWAGKFAVMDIQDIKWSSSLFDQLNIALEHKELIMASAMTCLGVVEGPMVWWHCVRKRKGSNSDAPVWMTMMTIKLYANLICQRAPQPRKNIDCPGSCGTTSASIIFCISSCPFCLPCWFWWWQVSTRELLHNASVLEDWLLHVFTVAHH